MAAKLPTFSDECSTLFSKRDVRCSRFIIFGMSEAVIFKFSTLGLSQVYHDLSSADL